EEVSTLPVPLPSPGMEEVSTLPVPLPSPGMEEVSTLPVPLPSPGMEEVSTLPVPLPSPGVEKAGSLPLPIPSPRSTAAEEGSSLPVPIPAPTSLEPPAVRGDLDQAESITGSPEGDKATPINLPDVQAVRGAGPETVVKFGDRTAVESAGEKMEATPITLPGQENPAPLPEAGEGTAGEEDAGAETTPAGEAGAGEGGEWTPPPDWYLAIGPDGKMIVVDADGNPVESPPQVQTVNPADGSPCDPTVFYPGSADGVELPYYSDSLDNCSIFIDSDGKPIVVDMNGNPLPLQPVVQMTNPEDGSPCAPKVYYPGSDQKPVELQEFTFLDAGLYLQGCSILVGADGKAVLVDADGNPKALQPHIQLKDESGTLLNPTISLDSSGKNGYALKYYSGNILDGCSVHVGADGKPVVVDASGKPLAVQPVIQTTNPDGSSCEPKVFYQGFEAEPVGMSYYSENLENCHLHTGADGKPVVVDANGVPLASQPIIRTVDENGQPCEPKIYYQGGEENPVSVSAYSAPLDGCSIYVGADGKPVVVDADGKPLPSQPVIQTVNTADGSPCPPQAYYKGAEGNPVELPYYTGPKPKTGNP
ncbi:MAG: hypothetical protein JW929_01135, partial [Anaerolineales bacterium]|nr:hypothetical protein [Anaerolineales bacterium]